MTSIQKNTVDAIVGVAESQKEVLAVLLCGSLAENRGRESSDVDVLVIVDDDDWDRRRSEYDYFWSPSLPNNGQFCPIDGKVVASDYLSKVMRFGDEPAKRTFIGSKVLICKDDAIKDIYEKEKERDSSSDQCRKFYSMMLNRKFTSDDDIGNVFQVKSCIIDTVYFASRLVLAHNRILFPCRKHMISALSQCKDKPQDFEPLLKRVLQSFSFEDLDRFFESVVGFFPQYQVESHTRKGYVLENEMFWYFNVKPYYEI